MQAVLLLLGGRDIPTGVPTIEVPFDQSNRVKSKFQTVVCSSFTFMFMQLYVFYEIFPRVWVTSRSARIFQEE